MHLITGKRIQEFAEKYPDSRSSLDNWYRIVNRTEYNSFIELRQHFPGADYVDGFIVFNISGNRYRLITAIHFNRKKVYIRHILTHSEDDRNQWDRGEYVTTRVVETLEQSAQFIYSPANGAE